jgi:putative ABC transport system substrate-binding protein
MENRRRMLAALGLCALAAPLGALAQQQGRVRRIGFLAARSRSTASNPDVYYDAFVLGMRELGYVEGKNLATEWRYADQKNERLPGLAAELVRQNVEVIVTHGTQATQAAQRATGTIPIVAAAVIDPVGNGFALSLARPGRNITGMSLITSDASPKHMELLKLLLPKLSRVVVLLNPENSGHLAVVKSLESAGQKVGAKILTVAASKPEEIKRSFDAAKRERADVIIVLTDSFFIGQRRQIADLAARNRLATMFSYREDVEAGGLMSYGQDLADYYHRAATYVDKILKGAKPGDLPIDQPARFHLAVNGKTAKALGLAIPQELLLRADEVIE